MIRGSTELVAIVGSPIAQVKSPENFNAWFGQQNQDRAMIAIDLAPDALEEFIATLRGWRNLRGCVVTVPYKQQLAEWLEHLSPRAAALHSVNVIRREADGSLSGDNVDGEGFIKAAARQGFVPGGRTALVIGSGGVGSAIAYSMAEAGIAQLTVVDASRQRADSLAGILRDDFPGLSISTHYETLAGFDLVVNASPVGMGDSEELPLPPAQLDTLSPATLVADVVTRPEITPLLAAARRRGCRIQTGAEMAIAQLGNLGAYLGVTPLDI
ncbi:shikimate dehydrogenase family protein [Stutzerimonas tarimensis]|uniref:Shikimate dehydrogenase family protein n=1 Tax=Stutzerimonas tarimensis TaxID=1507735 RepID=A0ABV7T6V9_9GAMM